MKKSTHKIQIVKIMTKLLQNEILVTLNKTVKPLHSADKDKITNNFTIRNATIYVAPGSSIKLSLKKY